MVIFSAKPKTGRVRARVRKKHFLDELRTIPLFIYYKYIQFSFFFLSGLSSKQWFSQKCLLFISVINFNFRHESQENIKYNVR